MSPISLVRQWRESGVDAVMAADCRVGTLGLRIFYGQILSGDDNEYYFQSRDVFNVVVLDVLKIMLTDVWSGIAVCVVVLSYFVTRFLRSYLKCHSRTACS